MTIRFSSALPLLAANVPQEQFVQRAANIRELDFAQAASRQRIESLFQSMLHQAFNGEL